MSEAASSPLATLRAWALRQFAALKALSRPAKALAASIAVGLLLTIGVVTHLASQETWAPLFTSLDREDAAALVAKLKELKVAYKLEGDGTEVMVPEGKVHELRLELASAGLPRGGAVGFESFDKMRLGATEFEEKVQYRRALEGELARTIATLSSVESARVHLVLPERSVFVSKAEPASASIVLRLKPGKTLGSSDVAGIVHLAAASVPALTPDQIALVSTDGTMLHRPKKAGGSGDSDGTEDSEGTRLSQARTVEAALEERARAMLGRMLGPGHVDVRITADVDIGKVERVEDRYDSSHAALRSEEQTVERGAGGAADLPMAGVPGAESNLPSKAPAAADGGDVAAASGSSSASAASGASPTTRESHTRNFEIDHVTEKRTNAGGGIKRLTVAVVVDGTGSPSVPRSREELDKIALLVKNAVGVDAARGDAVTVESLPFRISDDDDLPPPGKAHEGAREGGTLVALGIAKWGTLSPRSKQGVLGAGAAAALILLFLVSRLFRKKGPERALVLRSPVDRAAADRLSRIPLDVSVVGPAPPVDAQATPALEKGHDKAPAALPPAAPAAPPDYRALAEARAAADPASATLVLRAWLAEMATSETADKADKGDAGAEKDKKKRAAA